MVEEERVRVVVADDLRLQLEMMKAAFEADERFEVVGVAARGDELVEVAKRERPDLVLTDLHFPGYDGAQAIRILRWVLPACVFIVFSGEEDVEILKSVIDAGASDFLRKPLQMNRLREAVEEIYDREAPRKRGAHAPEEIADEGAPVLGVIGPQAGCGASTFAVNLAAGVAGFMASRVGFLDLDLQTAAATRYLGISEGPDLLSLFEGAEELRPEVVRRFLTQAHGLTVLAGPPFPLDEARQDTALLLELLQTFRREHDHVIVDLEPRMDAANRVLLGWCTSLYLVVPNDPAGLVAAARWLAVYRHTRPPEGKLKIVYSQTRPPGLAPTDPYLKALGAPIQGTIAYDPNGAELSVRLGQPAITNPESQLGRSMASVVETLLEAEYLAREARRA